MKIPSAARDDWRLAWWPVCASHDLVPRHVYHGKLAGQELAIWRADDGYVNVWENRCLHRGVRLSIGANTGADLVCAYHGWRYANRSAGCTYIPAHPADAPARTVRNRTYRRAEWADHVWVTLEGSADMPTPPEVSGVAIRSVPVAAAPADVEAAVAKLDLGAVIFVQPVDRQKAILRGLLAAGRDDSLTGLRRVNQALKALAERLEAAARQAPPLPGLEQDYRPVDVELAALPGATGRKAAHRCRVAARRAAGEEIVGLRLEPLAGLLPAFQPGAHIDVHLPGGLVRQYSLTNGPEETAAYEIAVKREPGGGGGSLAVHEAVRVGDVLAISAPHNNFPLRRDAAHTLFLAGGIGATPLIAMAKTLRRSGQGFDFHAFARNPAAVPLPETLAALGATLHVGRDPAATTAILTDLLAAPDPHRHVYICGPAPMMAAAMAAATGWAEANVHFQHFGNDGDIDTSSAFEVALSRSMRTLAVPAGRTILEVLREAGIDLPSSCEQGACGTCRCTVLEGVPDHQDVYLTAAEKAAGDQIMVCVSRARTGRLVLDL